jgi:hypothetical protein
MTPRGLCVPGGLDCAACARFISLRFLSLLLLWTTVIFPCNNAVPLPTNGNFTLCMDFECVDAAIAKGINDNALTVGYVSFNFENVSFDSGHGEHNTVTPPLLVQSFT